MAKTTYKHGLPFSQVLALNLDDAISRVEKKKASLIIIDGIVGSGKTTKAVLCADYINKHYNIGEMTLDRKNHPQLAMGGKAFQKQLRICFKQGFKVIIYDEAGDFNRRGALSQFNAMLNRTFDTYRAFKIIVILCLPLFAVLDKSLFDNGIPRMLINCHDRQENYGNFRGYSLNGMLWLKKVMDDKKIVIKQIAYKKVYPNFHGHFLDLSPARAKALDRISTSSKLEISKIQEIKMEGLVSYQDIANKLVRSIIWVKKAMVKMEIRPYTTIDRRKYFKGEVVDVLAGLIEDGGMKA